MPMHTPGPWATKQNAAAAVVVAYNEDAREYDIVAECTGPDRERNARAISAVPEMADLIAEIATLSPQYASRAAAILEKILHKET